MHCLQLRSGFLLWSTRLISENENDREIKSAPVVAKGVVIVGTHAGTVAGQVQTNILESSQMLNWVVVSNIFDVHPYLVK